MLLFPAKLKVIFQGTTQFFQTPDEAWSWIKERPLLGRRTSQAKERMGSSQERPKEKCQRRVLNVRRVTAGTTMRSLRPREDRPQISDSEDDADQTPAAQSLRRSSEYVTTEMSEREESADVDSEHPLLESIQRLEAPDPILIEASIQQQPSNGEED